MASVFKRGGKGNRHGWYYISYFDHNGKRQSRSAKTTDKATAERIAAKFEADAALRRDGVIDPTLDAIGLESRRAIESHVANFEARMKARNRSDDHVSRTVRLIRAIAQSAGFTIAADIAADGVNRYAGRLRDQGKSARTIQAHLTAIKALTKWLTENNKLPRDPLASVQRPNPASDRRRERRMLLPEEWRWLRVATENGPERLGVRGWERRLLYETAIQSGLRSNELRSLSRGGLFLDSAPPFITCKAGSTKNRKDARQYIQPELATELQTHVATRPRKLRCSRCRTQRTSRRCSERTWPTPGDFGWRPPATPKSAYGASRATFLPRSITIGNTSIFILCGTRASLGWQWPARIRKPFKR